MAKNLSETMRSIDWVLAVAAFLLIIIGLSTIYSTVLAGEGLSESLVIKQCIALCIGIFAAIILVRFDIRLLKVIVPAMYVILIILSLILLITADPIRGASSWFVIGGFQFQPSEFLKLATVLMLALYCANLGKKMRNWKNMLGGLILLLLPVALIAVQPDLGTAVVIFVTGAAVLFFSALDAKKVVVVLLIALVTIPFAYNTLADYQKQRINSFLNPAEDPLGAGYNQIQSVIAVGSGGLFGRGWGRGTQSHLRFLPEQHTDFIFATYTEEFGFIGALVVLSLIAIIIVRLVLLANRASDDFSRLICVGMATYILFQSLFNIGMNIGIFPVAGLPLPLMSYGGSSLIATLIALGLAEAVAVQRTN